MTVDDVRRRVREVRSKREHADCLLLANADTMQAMLGRERLYRDTLRTLLDHDISDDARQLIEAALEAER